MAWLKLKPAPTDLYYGQSVIKNDREVVLASDIYSKSLLEEYVADPTYIHKYNVHTNEWCQQFQYPLDWRIGVNSIAINKKSNNIYLSTYKYKLIIINIDTKEYNFHKYHEDLLIGQTKICNVNGKIHLIGDKHLIFDEENGEFKQIYNFNLDHTVDHIEHLKVIYIPSKMTFISFTFKFYNKGIINDEYSIWIFNLNTNKWHQYDKIINKYNFCILDAVLTYNEKFIIMINDDRKIYVMDITDDMDYKLSESSIKCPFKHRIVNMWRSGGGIQDEILVCGWIRTLFKKPKFKDVQLIPIYIMQLISNWYSIELIHFVSCINTHYAVNVKRILSNVKIKT